jgi:hypothetical protein
MSFSRTIKSIATICSWSLLWGAFALMQTSCGTRVENPVAAEGDDADADEEDVAPPLDTGGLQNVTVEDFEVTVVPNDEYTFYTSLDGARPVESCIASADIPASQWVTCIVDVEELDAFNNSWTLENSAPGEMCAYRGFQSYYYNFAYEDNDDLPCAVSYEVNTDTDTITPGSVKYHHDCDAVPNWLTVAPGDFDDPGSGDQRDPPASMTFNKAEDVVCPYDYSTRYEGGANCCKGKYYSVAYPAGGAAADAEISDITDWGGSPTNCYRGPGMEDSLAKSPAGWPETIITPVVGLGFRDSYTIEAPTNKRDVQIYLANYFDPDDHDGATMPLPLSKGFPYYRFDCYDHNREIVARIDVQFREWNVTGYSAAGVAANADLTGVEDAPFDDWPRNDFTDWRDRIPAGLAHTEFIEGIRLMEPFEEN